MNEIQEQAHRLQREIRNVRLTRRQAIRRALALGASASLLGGLALPRTSRAARSSQAASTQQFNGVEVTITGPAGQVEWIAKWTKKWEQQTGGKVHINTVPFSDLDGKILTATGTGTFLADVYNIGTQTAGQLMAGGNVLEVPQNLRARLDLSQIPDIYNKYQLTWNGKMYGIPWDGDMLMLNYRKDLLNDPTYQAEFKAKYGFDLAVPTSWVQYANIAAFLTGTDWNHGKPHYGLVELCMRQNHAWDGYLSRATGYAKYPGDPAFFFDVDTMKPRINNPGFVKALADWKTAMQWGPSDMQTYDWAANAQAFVGGRAGLDIQWGDIGPMSIDPNTSVVDGKVGYAVTPGSTQVWNAKTGKWETFAKPNQAPFAGFGGWIYVVPKLTKHPDAAFDVATFLGQPEVRLDAVTSSGTGVNPDSFTQLDPSIWVKAGFSEEDAKNYTAAIKDSLTHPNVVMDLRIPGINDYKDALEIGISKTLAGQTSPQQALDEVAGQWEAITNRLGRDTQRQYYRESLGLSST